MAEFSTLAGITVASVKTYFDIKATETAYDNLITAHLLGARDYVQTFCRHDFQSTTRTSEKPIINSGDMDFFLKYYPIASISSITEDGSALTEDTDFFCDRETGRVEKLVADDLSNLLRSTNSPWNPERNSVIVTYVGGEALTDDVIMVVKEICGINAGIKKRTYTDNEGVERVSTLNSYPPYIQDILKRHRHRSISR
jgi:hypothetical protein